jgi:hypothetical protein
MSLNNHTTMSIERPPLSHCDDPHDVILATPLFIPTVAEESPDAAPSLSREHPAETLRRSSG